MTQVPNSKRSTGSYAILDAQFGSCGKGLLAGYLAETRQLLPSSPLSTLWVSALSTVASTAVHLCIRSDVTLCFPIRKVVTHPTTKKGVTNNTTQPIPL